VFNIVISGKDKEDPGEGNEPPSVDLTVNLGKTPSSPVNVTLRAKVRTPRSGGHAHESSPVPDRPKPRLLQGQTWADTQTFTVSSSSFTTKFKPSMGNNNQSRGIAGEYVVEADFQGKTKVAKHDINIRYDLVPLLAGSTYYQRRQDTRHNGDYHYGTTTLRDAIVAAANHFWENWGKDQNPTEVMVINDQSLIWGGLFEIPTAQVWTASPGHQAHRGGRNVDLPFTVYRNGQQVAIVEPSTRWDKLTEAIEASFGAGGCADHGNHWHCTK
jgi:hypothetical protein